MGRLLRASSNIFWSKSSAAEKRVAALEREVQQLKEVDRTLVGKLAETERRAAESLSSKDEEIRLLKEQLESRSKEAEDAKAAARKESEEVQRWSGVISEKLVTGLESIGAVTPRFEGGGTGEFFGWLDGTLDDVPSIIETSTKYASLMSLEAGFGLLEGQGCSHVPLVTGDNVVISDSCCEGSSEAAHESARRVALEYWVPFGIRLARERALAHLIIT